MPNVWLQHYDPLHNVFLSTCLAALPVVVLLGTIAFLRVRIHVSALIALSLALLLAMAIYGMPWRAAGAAAVYGAAFGLFPIGWVILNVLFLYQLTVKQGLFEVLRQSLARVAPDPRIQLILIAFSFGAFIEGVAGFGTPVAITGAILIQLGFKPLHASGLALIANTAPVAFGSLGIPITTLEQVSGLSAIKLSAMVGRQLPFFSLIIPFWVVGAFEGWAGIRAVWPAALTAGLAFAIPQCLISNFHGPWMVDTISASCSMAAVVLLLRVWKPGTAGDSSRRDESTIAQPFKVGAATKEGGSPEGTAEPHRSATEETHSSAVPSGLEDHQAHKPNLKRLGYSHASLRDSKEQTPAVAGETTALPGVFRAWVPWLILTVFILLWGIPAFKKTLDTAFGPRIQMPYLHNTIQRGPEVASPEAKPEKAEFILNLLSATGTGILCAAVIAGFAMGCSLRQMGRVYIETIWRTRFSLLTIAGMLALGNVTKYSGADATLGLALAHTGRLYPFFGTLLGWLGVALTGSDTASNVLFGSLQRITAERTGLSPVLMGAANSSGGVMGKMIDAQSIVVASTATNWYGHEGSVLRFVFVHSIILAVLVGILVFLQAYVTPFNLMVVK